MYVTLPDADAMRLVKKQFAELWKKVETEIDTALCRNPDYGEHINAVREIALGVKCHVEDIHIARTAPVVGDPRREWRSMRFMSELSPLELQELVARNSGSKIPELAPATYEQETEPWRSTSVWQLENHINPALFRSNCDLSKCRDDPYLMALFAVHDGKEDEVVFGGKPYACNSWVRLLVDLSMDHLAIIQQSFAVREHAQISTEDYDAINAAFDAIPGFNYAALVENEASGVTSHPTSDLQEPTPDFRAAGDTLAAVKSESDAGLTAYDREIIESVIRQLDGFPQRQLNLIYSEEAEGRSFIPAMAVPFRFVCPRSESGSGGIGLFVEPCLQHATGCTIELGEETEDKIAEDWGTSQVLFDRLASILATDFAKRRLPGEALLFATAGRDLDGDRYNHLFWIRFLVGLSRQSPSPLPEFESFDPSCRVSPCGFEFNDDGSSRTIPLDEQRTDSAKMFLKNPMSKRWSPTFWKFEGKPAYSPPRCLEFQIPDIAIATVSVCRWLLTVQSSDFAIPPDVSKTQSTKPPRLDHQQSDSTGAIAAAGTPVPSKYCEDGKPNGPYIGNRTLLGKLLHRSDTASGSTHRRHLKTRQASGAVWLRFTLTGDCEIYFTTRSEFDTLEARFRLLSSH